MPGLKGIFSIQWDELPEGVLGERADTIEIPFEGMALLPIGASVAIPTKKKGADLLYVTIDSYQINISGQLEIICTDVECGVGNLSIIGLVEESTPVPTGEIIVAKPVHFDIWS